MCVCTEISCCFRLSCWPSMTNLGLGNSPGVYSSGSEGSAAGSTLECPQITLFGNCQLSTLLSKWIDSFYNSVIATAAPNRVIFGRSWWNITQLLCLLPCFKESVPLKKSCRITTPWKKGSKKWFFNSQLLNRWHSSRPRPPRRPRSAAWRQAPWTRPELQ